MRGTGMSVSAERSHRSARTWDEQPNCDVIDVGEDALLGARRHHPALRNAINCGASRSPTRPCTTSRPSPYIRSCVAGTACAVAVRTASAWLWRRLNPRPSGSPPSGRRTRAARRRRRSVPDQISTRRSQGPAGQPCGPSRSPSSTRPKSGHRATTTLPACGSAWPARRADRRLRRREHGTDEPRIIDADIPASRFRRPRMRLIVAGAGRKAGSGDGHARPD